MAKTIREIARASVGLPSEGSQLVEKSCCGNQGMSPTPFIPIVQPSINKVGGPTPRLRAVVRQSMGLGDEQALGNPESGLVVGDEEESTLESCLAECEQSYKTASTVAERRINRAMSEAFKDRLQIIKRARSSGLLVTRSKPSPNRRNPRGRRVQRYNVYGKFSTDGGKTVQIGESIKSIALRTTGGGYRKVK